MIGLVEKMYSEKFDDLQYDLVNSVKEGEMIKHSVNCFCAKEILRVTYLERQDFEF